MVKVDDVVKLLSLQGRHQILPAFINQVNAFDQRMGLDDLIVLNFGEVMYFGRWVPIGNGSEDGCGEHHIAQRAKANDQNLQPKSVQ